MVEEQVDEVLFVAQGQAVLAAEEGEAEDQLEKEILQALDQPVFELPFLDSLSKAEEL